MVREMCVEIVREHYRGRGLMILIIVSLAECWHVAVPDYQSSICAVVRATPGSTRHAGVTSNSELTVVKVHHRRGSVVPTAILFIFHLKHQHRLSSLARSGSRRRTRH